MFFAVEPPRGHIRLLHNFFWINSLVDSQPSHVSKHEYLVYELEDTGYNTVYELVISATVTAVSITWKILCQRVGK
jgi:hypothetical protein